LINRVYIETHGCSTNFADGEVIIGCVSKAGYKIVDKPETADALIFNTCAVKSPTENRMISLLKKVPNRKKMIVTGCLPLINFKRLSEEVSFDAALGPSPGKSIVTALKRVSRGEKIIDLRDNAMPPSLLPKTTINRMISILPTSYGCLGSCSYCCVRKARGRLRSYSIEDILARLRRDLEAGAKEVWLTSQDTGAYGKDIGENLIKLLDEVIEQKGEFLVRIGMMNPNHAIEMLHELTDIYKHQRIYKFIHIPVQSGDNEVLRSMNRGYTVEDFKEVVEAFRKEMPEITLSTDIICGFPSETEEAYERSVHLLQEIKPDVLNVSKFFARPNTPAKRMKPLPVHVINERSKNIAELHRRIGLEKNRKWLRWAGSVFVNNFKRGSWVGRNIAYKPVVLDTRRDGLLGEKVKVQIKVAKPTHLVAKCLL